MSEIESSSEIEDLINPTDELKKKIVAVASTIRKWNNETARVRKTVKEQFEEIRTLGLNKYKMENAALRRLVVDIFRIHGVSESWLRKLLPVELKDTKKTRISYLQKQEMEKERQRLQQSDLKYQYELDYIEYDVPNSNSDSFQPLQPETTQPSSEIKQEIDTDYTSKHYTHDQQTQSSYSSESINVQNELNEAYKKIEKLEADILRLSEQFVAKANLQAYTKTIPVVAHIDPVRKIITRIGFEKGSGI